MAFVIASNIQGPLPQSIPFTSPVVGPATVAISATAWTKSPGNVIGVVAILNGVKIGVLQLMTNQGSVHLTLPTGFFNADIESMQCTLMLVPTDQNTVTDQNDFFSAVILT